MNRNFILEVKDMTIYKARYMVIGYDDTLWTNDLDEAVSFLATQIGRFEYDNELKVAV